MQSPLDVLHHEAASLWGLVDFVTAYIQEQESSHTYPKSTKGFFDHFRRFAKETKTHLAKTVQNAQHKPDRIDKRYRPGVTIYAGWWATLHAFLKPATDAHALSVPVPLINLAEQCLCAIPGCEDCSLVVLHTPELMYFQSEVRRRDKLPENTALVEVPYSQGPSFFTNLNIFHEMGHFVFSRPFAPSSRAGRALTRLGDMIATVINSQPKLASREFYGDRVWAKERLEAWAQEIFCDLFALQLVGPAFSFAMIDLLRLAGMMRDGTELVFTADHPAPACRLREHKALLQKNEWWKEIAGMRAEHVALIERLATEREDDYRLQLAIDERPKDSEAVRAFVKQVVPLIELAVRAITRGENASVDDFRSTRNGIEKCLANGVVPSSLITRPSLSPKPASIINAAYCFYLTDLAVLMSKLRQKPSVLSHRKDWAQRIEAWTLKSIEDYELIKGARA